MRVFMTLLNGNLRDAHVLGFASSLASLRYSRAAEAEADSIGMGFIHAAQIDPKGAVQLMKTLESLDSEESRVDQYLSTHPSLGNRVVALEAEANRSLHEVKPLLLPARWETLIDQALNR